MVICMTYISHPSKTGTVGEGDAHGCDADVLGRSPNGGDSCLTSIGRHDFDIREVTVLDHARSCNPDDDVSRVIVMSNLVDHAIGLCEGISSLRRCHASETDSKTQVYAVLVWIIGVFWLWLIGQLILDKSNDTQNATDKSN